MGECRRGSRVGQVVRRDVDCLNRSDGSLPGGSDTLLQGTHVCCQRRLVTDGGRHTAQKRRHFGTCLCETENVVDEEQHVLIFDITEVLCHGQSGKADTHTGSRRLVHLTVDQCGLVDNAALLHLAIEVVALTGTLADTCKNRDAAVRSRDVVDQLHDQDGLAYTCAAEQTDLTALCVRADQVDDLDAGLEDLRSGDLVFKGRCGTMDRPALLCVRCGLIVYRVAQKVEYSSQAFLADRNRNGTFRVDGIDTADQSVGGAHGDASDNVITNLLCHLGDQSAAINIDLDGIEQCRQLALLEPDVKDRTGYLYYLADMFFTH